MVTVMKADGCKAVTLWNDGSTYGAGLARNIEIAAKKQGLPIKDQQRTDKTAANYRSLAKGIKTDCFAWAGVTAENGVQVVEGRRRRRVRAASSTARRGFHGGVHQPEEGRHPG